MTALMAFSSGVAVTNLWQSRSYDCSRTRSYGRNAAGKLGKRYKERRTSIRMWGSNSIGPYWTGEWDEDRLDAEVQGRFNRRASAVELSTGPDNFTSDS